MTMSNVSSNDGVRPGIAFARLAALAVGITGLLAALGYWPTRTNAGPGGPLGMLLGLGAALVAALAGLVPALLALKHGPRERLNGLLAGMAVRFVLMLGMLLAVLLSGWADRVVTALWAVVGYVVLLAVDTVGLSRLNQRLARACP
jgi:hypothetical protein